MAMSTTERQKAYRQRARQNDRQLNMWIDHRAALALARLAKHDGVSQRAVIERLVKQADDAVLAAIEFESPQWHQYLGTGAVTA